MHTRTTYAQLGSIARWSPTAERLAVYLWGALDLGVLDASRVHPKTLEEAHTFFLLVLGNEEESEGLTRLAARILRDVTPTSCRPADYARALDGLKALDASISHLARSRPLSQSDVLTLEILASFFTRLSEEAEAASYLLCPVPPCEAAALSA